MGYKTKGNHIENVQSRYSNKTVTLIVHSPKYSDRRVTCKKTAQLQSIQPMGGSARVKSTSRQVSWSKITLHMVHLESVTVRLHPRQTVDSLARSSHPLDNSATFKISGRRFS